jgi:hypothetical protein
MRTTDRQFVSEAVRLSGKWTYLSRTPSVILGKGPSFDERLVIRYGSVGQIVEADHRFPGVRNGIRTDKRRRVLKIIEGKQRCSTCGLPVERNRRDELLHVDRMGHAHDHAATLDEGAK